MPLTHFQLTNAKPATKPYKLSDGGGLHIIVKPNGAKLWRLKYRFLGKERLLSFGTFPLFSLADARAKRDEAKKLLASGVDPNVKKKLDRLAAETAARNTFGLVAEEFINSYDARGSAESTKSKQRWLLLDIASPLANRPIAEITPAEVLDLLKRIERSGRRETARRLRSRISAVFRYAIVTLRASRDPTAALTGAITPPKVTHRAAITDEKQLGGLLRAIDEFEGGRPSKRRCSLQPSPAPAPARCAARVVRKSTLRKRYGGFPLNAPRCADRMTLLFRVRR